MAEDFIDSTDSVPEVITESGSLDISPVDTTTDVEGLMDDTSLDTTDTYKEPMHISENDFDTYLEVSGKEDLELFRDNIASGNIQVDSDLEDALNETDEGPVLVRDADEQWEVGCNAIENNVEAMRDDLRDKGFEDESEIESIVMPERAAMQEELQRNIEGDFSESYYKPDFNELLEKPESIEAVGDVASCEGVADGPENIESLMDEVSVNEISETDETVEETDPVAESIVDLMDEVTLNNPEETNEIQNGEFTENDGVSAFMEEVADSNDKTPEISAETEVVPTDTTDNVNDESTDLSFDGDLVEQGMDPSDYAETDWTDTHVEEFREEMIALGIPEESPELDAMVENEQRGIDEINNQKPIDDSTDDDFLDNAEEIIDKAPTEAVEGTDMTIDAEISETVEEVAETPRVFDDFEKSILENKPDFYESGSFYEQGINEFGYEGTCGPTSQANALNKLFGTNEFTENKVLSVAIDNNLCSIDSSPENCGGTTADQFMDLYDKMNEQIGGKIETQLYEYENALDVNDVASKLDEGCVLNVAVDANALWDQPRDYVNSMGIPCDDFYSDHWITVTGVQRDELGNVKGFDIIDSGGGVDYVSADKYHEMCFGTDEHKVIDPTAIVVSKKDTSSVGEISATEDTGSDINNNSALGNNVSSWFQRIFERRNR